MNMIMSNRQHKPVNEHVDLKPSIMIDMYMNIIMSNRQHKPVDEHVGDGPDNDDPQQKDGRERFDGVTQSLTESRPPVPDRRPERAWYGNAQHARGDEVVRDLNGRVVHIEAAKRQHPEGYHRCKTR